MGLLKVLVPITLAALMSYCVTTASAQESPETGVYLRGDLGWSLLNWGDVVNDKDSAFIGGGGVGYQFNEYFRTDLRVDWSGTYEIGWFDDDVDFVTATGNVYLDIPITTFVTPYIGAGAGYAWANIDRSSDSGFTFAGMTGFAFEVADSVDVDLGFRFLNISAEGPDIQAYQWLAGIRYGF